MALNGAKAMAQTRIVVDITDNAELRQVVDDAIAARQPIILRIDDVEVAALEPLVLPSDDPDADLEADFADFASTFGAWSDIDGEELKARIRADRGSSQTQNQS
jgi:hypothetical protein